MTARGPALQLTNVTRGDGAEYWCEAANSEGVGQSGRVTVTVDKDIQLSLSLSTPHHHLCVGGVPPSVPRPHGHHPPQQLLPRRVSHLQRRVPARGAQLQVSGAMILCFYSLYCIMNTSAPRWQYNSSQGSFQIPNAKSMMSFMNYAVTGEGGGGEGEVLCWASNEVCGNYMY